MNRRGLVLVMLVIIVLLAVGLRPVRSAPDIPRGLGYCVTVEDAGGVVGVRLVPFHRPDPENLEEFKASLRSAVILVGLSSGRNDVVLASVNLSLEPQDVRRKGDSPTPGSCRTVCTCATPICSSGVASCGPEDIVGCGGGCGSCEKCIVSCPSATGNRK